VAEKLKDKQETKTDIVSYENQKKKIRLANGAIVGGLSAVGAGAYLKNPALAGAGAGASALAGFLRGKAVKEKEKSSMRMKERYGVKRPTLFNPSAFLPSKEKVAAIATMDKTAIVGSILHMISELTGAAPHIPHAVNTYAPVALDFLSIPAIGIAAKKSFQNLTEIALKNKLGKSLTPSENIRLGVAEWMKGLHEKSMKSPLAPVRYLGAYAAAPAAGIEFGEAAAKPLKYMPESVKDEFLRVVKNFGPTDAIKNEVESLKRTAMITGAAAATTAGANIIGQRKTKEDDSYKVR
jgi:hypothetical protein